MLKAPVSLSIVLLSLSLVQMRADVPQATYYNNVEVTINGTTQRQQSNSRTNGYSISSGSGTATTSNDFSSPAISAQASIGDNDGDHAMAESGLNYYLQVVGPDGNVSVLVQASGNAMTSGYGFASVSLYLDRSTPGVDPGINLLISANHSNPNLSFLVDGYYTFTVNSIYEIHMDAYAHTGSSPPDAESAYAFVDPYFQVPAGYQLVLSPDIGNRAAVPEPSGAAMMIIGFVVVGYFGYRRRAVAA